MHVIQKRAPAAFVADVASLALKRKAVSANSKARVALTLPSVVFASHPASAVRTLKCTNTTVPGCVPYECAYFTNIVLFTLSSHYLRRRSALFSSLERVRMLTECWTHFPACVVRTTTLACEDARWPPPRGPSSTGRFLAAAAATTTDEHRDRPPRERTQRDCTLTPLRFGVRTKVSLRADGFVPVLHLQGDVAIAVNALSGMQGVPARSPVYLLEPLLGLLPRTRRLRFVLRDSQEELGGQLQCAFSWFVSSPCECVSAFF